MFRRWFPPPEPGNPSNFITTGVATAHLPTDLTVAGTTLPSRVAWLDATHLVYPSRSGIELLPASGGQPATLPGHYWQTSPAPDGHSIAYWGEAGLGVATTEPLKAGKVLWDKTGMDAWARDQVGAGARWWVEDTRWSPDSLQVAALLRAESPAHDTASALVVFDAARGTRLMLWGRSGREGLRDAAPDREPGDSRRDTVAGGQGGPDGSHLAP